MGNNMNIVEEFKKVRDIPYKIPLSSAERDDCCSGKADRLFRVFRENGYEVRYCVCTFKWSDLSLPSKLTQIPHDDECTHTYLEVKIDNRWIAVDASWDERLGDIFDINDWDGRSDTKIAVPIRECFSPELSAEYVQSSTTIEAIEEDLRKNGEFYQAFNRWLKEQRKK